MTETDIANGALRKQGIPTIDDIDSTSSKVAKSMKAAFEGCRQTFLREAAPGFARKTVALAVLTGETDDIYDYVYAYPADAIKLRYIDNGSTLDSDPIDFETGANAAGTAETILTDQASAIMVYTRDITHYNLYAADDIKALEYLLAWETAMINTRQQSLADSLERKFSIALAISQKNNMREQKVKQPDNRKFINARRR
jgi:hypothetical protein